MPVYRVKKDRNFTAMSNHHFKNRDLSMKAKGLLSQMLSLPDDWDYSLRGLAAINKEGVDGIRTMVEELEVAGYIVRRRYRDQRGVFCITEFTIYEQPQLKEQNATGSKPPSPNIPILEKPVLENPI